ncbi:hypothetical protein [Alteromonas gilva]|uniref:Lipoprotein n=1 Tax=Alteromonas gilva TaxID=2987522 RepID=A0ABT5KXW1_9ALTE|nr:hypothetical protein [Alteromonas gilva]MDC8829472.1 hypothetical protein [Alteromonas gilva]
MKNIKLLMPFSLIFMLLLGGCTSLDGRQLASSAYKGKFYVEHQPKDSRDLHINISRILNDRGLDAAYGDQVKHRKAQSL